MTAAISYEAESSIVETDADSRLHLAAGAPHLKYVRIVETDGTIRLVPLDHLTAAERVILEDQGLYDSIRAGLKEFAAGESVSSDWLLDDE